MVNKILFSILFSFIVCACSAKIEDPISGGVYVSNQLLENKELSYDSIMPILALRIDSVFNNKLFVKYRFGREIIMDINFEFKKSCSCFTSIGLLSFAPNGSRQEIVNLYILSPVELILTYSDNNNQKSFKYKFTYKDEVNYETYRDIYYAEDGFELFESN